MKNKKSKYKYLSIFGIGALLFVPALLCISLNISDPIKASSNTLFSNNKESKANQTTTINLTKDDLRAFNYEYSEYVRDDIKGIFVTGNSNNLSSSYMDFTSTTPDASKIAYGIIKVDDHYEFYVGDHEIVNSDLLLSSGVNGPGLSYVINRPIMYVEGNTKELFEPDFDQLNGRVLNKTILDSSPANRRVLGVVKLTSYYYSTDYQNDNGYLAQYSIWDNVNNSNSSLLKEPKSYIIDNFVTDDRFNKNSWNDRVLSFIVADNRIWFRQASEISSIVSKNLQDITLNNFKKITSFDDFMNYFDVNILDFPIDTYISYYFNQYTGWGWGNDPCNITIEFNDEQQQAIIKVHLPQRFNGDGFLKLSSAPNPSYFSFNTTSRPMDQSITIPYSSFKEDIPPTSFNDQNVLLNNNQYIFDASKYYRPFFDWNNNDIAVLNTKLFETITTSWSSIMWINLPNGLSSTDGLVTIDLDNSKLADGEVVISSLVLKASKYFDEGFVYGTADKDFLEGDQTLKITGLNRAPTIPWTKNTPNNCAINVTNDNWIEWDAYNYYNNGIWSDFRNTYPSNFNPPGTGGHIIDWNDVRMRIIKNLPSEYDANSFQFVEKIPHDENGTLDVKFKIKNYNDQKGNLVTTWSDVKLRLVGLKSSLNWNPNLNNNGQYEYQLDINDSLQDHFFGDITVEMLEKYLNDNKNYFIPNIQENTEIKLADDSLNKDANNGAITISNVTLIDGNGNNITLKSPLAPLTINNFIFAPINLVPKTNITSPYFASELLFFLEQHYDDINNPTSVVDNTVDQLLTQLNVLYEGTDTIDKNIFNIEIDENTTSAINDSGRIDLALSIIHKDSGKKINLVNNFEIDKKGISSLLKTNYYDDNKTLQELYDYLNEPDNANDFLANANNGIINPNGIPSGKIKYSFKNLTLDQTNQKLTADVYMKSAVSLNAYTPFTAEPMLLGSINLFGIQEIVHQETILIKNNDYLTDPAFSNISTPTQFKNFIGTNPSQDLIKKIVILQNAPVDQTNPTTINLVDQPIINGKVITYKFTVSPAYDANGILVPTSREFSFDYTFPNADQTTVITPINQISDDKYAFEYNVDELEQINGLIIDKPADANVNLVITKVDNRNRSITATVTLDKYYNEDGVLKDENLEKEVIFTGAKAVVDYTRVSRNDVEVDLSIDEFKTILDDKNKDELKSYIKFINDPNIANFPIEWEITSYEEVPNKLGLFNVTISLTNNYFKNDDTLTFIKDGTKTPFVIPFAIYPKIETKFDENIVENKNNNEFYYAPNFLELASNANEIITPSQISDDTLKNLIPNLLENNPGLITTDITYKKVIDEQNNQIILRDVTLKKYYDNSDTPITGTKNIGTLIIKYKTTPTIVDSVTLDPTVVPTSYDTYIDANSIGFNNYASSIVNDFINGNQKLNEAIFNAIKTQFLYYNDNQQAVGLNISDIKLFGGSATNNLYGGLSVDQYQTFLTTGNLPNNSLNNQAINSTNVTTDYYNFKVIATIDYTDAKTQVKKQANASAIFFNTKPLVLPTTDLANKQSFTLDELKFNTTSEVNYSSLKTHLEDYYNANYKMTDNPNISVDINTIELVQNTLNINVTIHHYVTNSVSPKIIIKDLTQDISLSGFDADDTIKFETTTLTSDIEYTTVDLADTNINLLDDNQIASELIKALKAKDYFSNLPGSFNDDTNGVFIKSWAIENNEVVVTFYLKKYQILGQEIENTNTNNLSGPTFKAILKGYNTDSYGFAALNTTIDLSTANNKNINEVVNNGVSTPAIDWKNTLKELLIDYLNQNTFSNEIKTNLLTYINGASFNPNITVEQVTYATDNKVNGIIKVVDSQIATISGENKWNNGFIFNFINAEYKVSKVIVKDATLTNSISFDDFKKDPTLIDINQFLTLENLPPNANVQLKAGIGNNEQGIGQIIIHFDQYYNLNGVVETNYDLVLEQNFEFKKDSSAIVNDILKNTISADLLAWNNYSVYSLIAYLNADANKDAINQLLINQKNLVTNDGIDSTNYDYQTIHASVSDDKTSVLWIIEINGKDREVIEITNLKPFVANEFTPTNTLPSGINMTNIKDYFTTGDLTTKTKEFIDWTGSNEILPNGEKVSVQEAKVFGVISNSAYINFRFNGIFDANGNYIENYVVQVKITQLPNARYNIEIVKQGSIVSFSETPTKKNYAWIAVITIFLTSIFAAAITTIFFGKKKKIKNKEGKQ